MSKRKEGLHYLSLFIIVCITMNLIMMCLFIKQGSSQVINKYKKQLKYEVTLSSDNGISIRDAKQLTTIKDVKTYNYEQLVNASSHTLKSVNTRLSFSSYLFDRITRRYISSCRLFLYDADPGL